MLTALVVLLRSIGLICCGYKAVALVNLALRQQLAALTRTVKRPRLRCAPQIPHPGCYLGPARIPPVDAAIAKLVRRRYGVHAATSPFSSTARCPSMAAIGFAVVTSSAGSSVITHARCDDARWLIRRFGSLMGHYGQASRFARRPCTLTVRELSVS